MSTTQNPSPTVTWSAVPTATVAAGVADTAVAVTALGKKFLLTLMYYATAQSATSMLPGFTMGLSATPVGAQINDVIWQAKLTPNVSILGGTISGTGAVPYYEEDHAGYLFTSLSTSLVFPTSYAPKFPATAGPPLGAQITSVWRIDFSAFGSYTFTPTYTDAAGTGVPIIQSRSMRVEALN